MSDLWSIEGFLLGSYSLEGGLATLFFFRYRWFFTFIFWLIGEFYREVGRADLI